MGSCHGQILIEMETYSLAPWLMLQLFGTIYHHRLDIGKHLIIFLPLYIVSGILICLCSHTLINFFERHTRHPIHWFVFPFLVWVHEYLRDDIKIWWILYNWGQACSFIQLGLAGNPLLHALILIGSARCHVSANGQCQESSAAFSWEPE